jgi:phage/plasmid-associated DNA primase
MDGGTRRRIAIAPFPSTLPPEQVITDYQGVLFKECGPAILQWVIDGAVRFYAGGCKLPMARCVKKATKEYLENEDWFTTFLSDTCELGESYEAPAGELYQAYQVWAGQNGLHPKRSRDFAAMLEANDFQKRADMKGKFWRGLRLKVDM